MDEIAEPMWKYEAIELLHEITVADGVAEARETALLRDVAEQMNLDYAEIEKIRAGAIIAGVIIDVQEDSSAILRWIGIPEDAPTEVIKKKLREAFGKWSGQLNSFQGEERENVQRFINSIAEIRRRYE